MLDAFVPPQVRATRAPTILECLDGIGYREQELQQAKGSRFSQEATDGISMASFGGGTNIFVQGEGIHDNP